MLAARARRADTQRVQGLRVPGVLGGMGPATTVDFMSTVLDLTQGDRDQDHIPMLIDHNPLVPDRQPAIHGDDGAVRTALVDMAQRLERAGADFLVMPCNTAHLFIDDALQVVSLPFLSIVDVTLEALLMSRRSVGLLAADATLYSELYQTALIAAGHQVILPVQSDQRGLVEFGVEGRVRGQEPDASPRHQKRLQGHIDDAEKRQRNHLQCVIYEQMRGVAGHHEKIRARPLQTLGHVDQRCTHRTVVAVDCRLAVRDQRIVVDKHGNVILIPIALGQIEHRRHEVDGRRRAHPAQHTWHPQSLHPLSVRPSCPRGKHGSTVDDRPIGKPAPDTQYRRSESNLPAANRLLTSGLCSMGTTITGLPGHSNARLCLPA
ncbi:MAG: amino acid racemase [Myxococcota bacterium]